MTFDDVRALALPWPDVEDSTSYRTPALKVRGKLLARLREDGETLVLPGVERDERDMVIEAAPDVFHVTPHYADWPSVLVRLPAADVTHVEPLLRRRWAALAPKRRPAPR